MSCREQEKRTPYPFPTKYFQHRKRRQLLRNQTFTAPRENEATKSRSHRLTCVCQFALYLDSLGYDAYILPEHKGLERSYFVPYIFTHDEMKAVIRAVDDTEPQTVARDIHRSLPVIFRILYGCGLRVSEVLKLQYRDVNLNDGILTIREAKTDRDRLIPDYELF